MRWLSIRDGGRFGRSVVFAYTDVARIELMRVNPWAWRLRVTTRALETWESRFWLAGVLPDRLHRRLSAAVTAIAEIVEKRAKRR